MGPNHSQKTESVMSCLSQVKVNEKKDAFVSLQLVLYARKVVHHCLPENLANPNVMSLGQKMATCTLCNKSCTD